MDRCMAELSLGLRTRRHAIPLSALLLVVCFLAAVFIGSRTLDLYRALRGLPPDYEILFSLRLPRALLAIYAGGALGLSGVLFQALLRNPLADPYTLGVSGGASLGAVVAISLGLRSVAALPAVSACACIGAAVVLMLIVIASSAGGQMSSVSLLLAGVTVNSICLAIIVFISSLLTVLQSFAVTHWLMGGLDAPDYMTLLLLTAVLLPVSALVFFFGRQWNVLAMGEAWAATHGVSPHRLLLLGCVAGSLLTGIVTALTGPIGFVGLVIPHAVRLWVGADHRVLAPCSFLIAAAFLALSDVLSRTLLAPVEIPVGVITAALGGPVFIWMLRSHRSTNP
jgi:iron complex transport system permease protein